MLLTSLNWNAYWQQVQLLKPKVAQPSILANDPGMPGSHHPILRHQKDPRLLAAETALIEVMAPLFEVGTWLGYRDAIARQPEIWGQVREGGEYSLDITWCHYAKANLTGSQESPRIHFEERMSYDSVLSPYSAHNNFRHGQFKERACVVLYQTPVVHGDKKAMGRKTWEYRKMGIRLRERLEVFQIVDIRTAQANVYDIFLDS